MPGQYLENKNPRCEPGPLHLQRARLRRDTMPCSYSVKFQIVRLGANNLIVCPGQRGKA
jgi:hypothetical protein